MRGNCLILVAALTLGSGVSAQTLPEERPVSLKQLVPNIGSDQKKIWTFPLQLAQGRHWVPTAAFLGATTGLVFADPVDSPHFLRTSSFSGFNSVFTGRATELGTLLVPVSLYAAGLIRKDSYQKNTALLATEAFADSEILCTVLKDAGRRLRPWDVGATGNFNDTWFDSKGKIWRGNGSFPSGHTIAAFSIATVVARRYGTHRWVPFVAYGMAAVVGFSRITQSAHFPSDVFVGATLGYSIARFSVLRQ